MAKIVTPIKDFLTKLRTLSVTNGDHNLVAPTVRIWNNQLTLIKAGNYPIFPFPAFFVEIVNDAVFENIGQGFRSADLSFRVHIIHEYYDAADGTFEQDLPVFTLRDMLIQNLTGYNLTACGPLEAVAETQDYDHDNLYHYIITFVCNFTDSTGSKYDPTHPQAFIETVPPVSLEQSFTIQH